MNWIIVSRNCNIYSSINDGIVNLLSKEIIVEGSISFGKNWINIFQNDPFITLIEDMITHFGNDRVVSN